MFNLATGIVIHNFSHYESHGNPKIDFKQKYLSKRRTISWLEFFSTKIENLSYSLQSLINKITQENRGWCMSLFSTISQTIAAQKIARFSYLIDD